jgi:uncharacterized repeat protein (TIGR01451 family)
MRLLPDIRSAGRRAIVVFSCAALVVAGELDAQARTVLNRGFEAPVLSVDWRGVPDVDVPGWFSPDGVIELWRSGFNGVPAIEGGQFAEANANSPSGFWQDVCLVAGESVPWRFFHRGRAGVDSMRVTLDGVEIARVGTGTGAWVEYTGTFVAPTSGPARVQFTPLNPGSLGNFVDDVVFDLVPHVEVGPDTTVPEGSGAGAILLVSGTLATPQTVEVVVTGGTAQAGADYSLTTTLSLPAGIYDGTPATGVPLSLGVQSDGVAEGDETIVYELANPSAGIRLASADAAACGAPARSAATITIDDDDEADLRLRKSGPETDVQAGADVTYELRTENRGPDDVVGVVVTDTLPPGATFVSATRGATESGGVVVWPAIALADGDEIVDEITLRFAGSGVQDQIAAVRSPAPDVDLSDNRDALSVDVCGAAVTTVSTVAGLRAAVADECVETILVEPGTYLLTSSGSGELRIESDKQVLNAGGGTVRIDGGGASRVFRTDDGTVTVFDGLEVVGGAVTGGDDGGGFRTDGDVTIRNTLISGNQAQDNGGGLNQNGGTLRMENVTVTGNASGDRGGGLAIRSSAELLHVTVAGNTSGDDGAGISREGGGSGPRLENVLVADNAGPGGQIRRSIRAFGVNLVEGGCAGCRAGVDLTGDPALAALAQNGGTTRTMALPLGSIAVDAAPNVLTVDQRGITRPQGAGSDIGAYERVQVPPGVDVAADTPTASRLPSNGVAYAAAFTVSNVGGRTATYDLTAQGTSPTVVVDSIRGVGLSFAARPDSARTGAVAAGEGLAVVVWYSVGDAALGASAPISLSATDVALPGVNATDAVEVTVVRPQLSLSKSAVVAGDTIPGSLVTYRMVVSNLGTEGAELVVVSDSLPAQVAYLLGSATESLPGGLSAALEFADAPGAWGYTPTSGGCGAAPGFDACVRFVRWSLAGTLPAPPGSNSGTFEFTSVIR